MRGAPEISILHPLPIPGPGTPLMSLSFKHTGSRIESFTPLELRRGLRVEPRIQGFFPALVRGVDASGEPFQVHTLLDNFGATEFYLRLSRRVDVGRRLFVLADIYEASIALHGRVMRLDEQPDGAFGLTVAVQHHRFI